jgi:hypothetical protein
MGRKILNHRAERHTALLPHHFVKEPKFLPPGRHPFLIHDYPRHREDLPLLISVISANQVVRIKPQPFPAVQNLPA